MGRCELLWKRELRFFSTLPSLAPTCALNLRGSGPFFCSAMAAPPANGRVFQFKLVLLGDSAVGKSSLVLRFVRGQFFEYQESTIGAAFLTQVLLNRSASKL